MRYEILIKYNEYVNKLKKIVRTGWIRSGIREGESVAEHLFHTTINLLILKKLVRDIKVNWEDAFVTGLLHDLAEVEVGDIPSYEKSLEDRVAEKSILSQMFRELGLPMEWVDKLFKLEDREAILVKVADLMATILQGVNYVKNGVCSEYIEEIILNSLNEIDKLLRLLDSRDLNLLLNFMKGYVIATIRRSCRE